MLQKGPRLSPSQRKQLRKRRRQNALKVSDFPNASNSSKRRREQKRGRFMVNRQSYMEARARSKTVCLLCVLNETEVTGERRVSSREIYQRFHTQFNGVCETTNGQLVSSFIEAYLRPCIDSDSDFAITNSVSGAMCSVLCDGLSSSVIYLSHYAKLRRCIDQLVDGFRISCSAFCGSTKTKKIFSIMRRFKKLNSYGPFILSPEMAPLSSISTILGEEGERNLDLEPRDHSDCREDCIYGGCLPAHIAQFVSLPFNLSRAEDALSN